MSLEETEVLVDILENNSKNWEHLKKITLAALLDKEPAVRFAAKGLLREGFGNDRVELRSGQVIGGYVYLRTKIQKRT